MNKKGGFVPVVEFTGPNRDIVRHRMVPWQEAAYTGPAKPDHPDRKENLEPALSLEEVREQMVAALPPVVTRSPRARYQAILEQIAQAALGSYRLNGYVAWPGSLETQLKAIGWADGDPNLAGLGGLDKVRAQVEALAKKYVDEGAQVQRAKDRRKVTLDWSGQYSA